MIIDLKTIVITKGVSSRRKEHHNDRLFNQSDESLSIFVIDSNIQASVAESETVKTQNDGFVTNSGSATPGGNSANQNQSLKNILSTELEKRLIVLLL